MDRRREASSELAEDPRTGPGDDTPVTPTTIGQTMVDLEELDFSASGEGVRKIHRYLVLDKLGAGGMGVVYSAYDPELDRKLAVKLIRGASGAAGRSRADARLLREAQAMARLSHPNVVQIYDVGVVQDRVYIAMELVEGGTLAQWMGDALKAEHPHPWREVVQRFLEAAEGLAAAHRLEIVHRDFKPDNVLIGAEGRVRVGDFGLARAQTETGSHSQLNLDEDTLGELGLTRSSVGSGSRSEAIALTRSGALLGTPAYMAPEQWEGRSVEAAADQFAFFVALYEALYGTRPFSGKNPTELMFNVVQGRIDAAPASHHVPSALRRTLLRGLAVDPSERYPDMPAAIAALASHLRPSRTPFVLAGVVGVAALAVALGRGNAAASIDCSVAPERLASVWNADARDQVTRALSEANRTLGPGTAARVLERLDEHATRWHQAHTDACRATHELRQQSEHVLDLRRACLDRRLDEMEATLRVLSSADETTVENAVSMSHALPSLAGCANLDALNRVVPPPSSPEARAKVTELRRGIEKARADSRSGGHDRARANAASLRAEAAELAYVPVQAEVAWVEGFAACRAGEYEEAEASFVRAERLSIQSDHDTIALRATLESVRCVGYGRSLPERGLEFAGRARAWIARGALADPRAEVQLLTDIGAVHKIAGDYTTSIEAHESALAMAERALAKLDPLRATIQVDLANTLVRVNRAEEGVTLIQSAIELREAALGPDHPDLAHALHNLGNAVHSTGDRARAVEIFEDALARSIATLGKDHPRTAYTLNSLADVLSEQGELERAIELYRRALAIREAALGARHPRVGDTLNNLGTALEQSGERAQAVRMYERALDIWTESLGPDHPHVAAALHNLGTMLYDGGDAPGAITYLVRARDAMEAKLGGEHPRLAYPLTGLGSAYTQVGQHEQAVASLERALQIRVAGASDPGETGETRHRLSEALWAAGGQRARARELAEQALQDFAQADDGYKRLGQAAQAWAQARGWVTVSIPK